MSASPESTDFPADPSAIQEKVSRVRMNSRGSQARSEEWRRAQLTALDTMLVDHTDVFEKALADDLGKHALESFITEVSTVRTEIKHTLKHLRRWTSPRRVRTGLGLFPSSAKVIREPVGTVLIIAPWNYPLHLLLMPFVGALAAGNSVVLKPSEVAPATAKAIERLVPQYLDTDAVAVINGGVEETTALLAMPWDHIFFTGNETVGTIVATAAARHLSPVTLELGGKSPVWVDPSADLATAAAWIAWGKLLNTGQTCVAPDYVLTTADIADQLVEAVKAAITAMYGTLPRSNPDYGRIVNSRHLERLVALLEGPTIAFGGEHDPSDRYLDPTILTDVAPEHPVMLEEIFGPILPIVVVGDAAEAIDFINARPKPLAMYLFAQSKSVVDTFIGQTSSGGVAVNSVLVQIGEHNLPFGGVGASGYGAYHGEASIRTFSHERSVLVKGKGPNLVKFGQAPYTAKKERALRGRDKQASER